MNRQVLRMREQSLVLADRFAQRHRGSVGQASPHSLRCVARDVAVVDVEEL